MKKLIQTLGLVGLLGLVSAGCGPKPTIEMQTEEQNTSQRIESNTKYEIKRVDVFYDNLAYNGKRGIYEIKNKETGEEFVGISGVGISELNSHHSGKSTTGDER